MQYTKDILQAPDEEIVCWCAQVTKGQILEAKKNGAQTLEAIRQVTGACTQGECTVKNPRGRCCATEILQLLGAGKKTGCTCGHC